MPCTVRAPSAPTTVECSAACEVPTGVIRHPEAGIRIGEPVMRAAPCVAMERMVAAG